MNRETLLKLKNNPFYKLSAKQQAELDEMERDNYRMIEFGGINLHSQSAPIHEYSVGKKKRVK